MPVGHLALAPREQHEPLVEPVGDLARAERAGARRRQLDGERQPVEPAAQPRDVGGVVLAQLEARAHGHGALGEQARRSGGADFVDAVAVRQSEWLERQHVLPCHPERLAARREHARPVRGGDLGGDGGSARQHVLAVVEHDQQLPAEHQRGQVRLGVLARHRAPAEHGGDGERDRRAGLARGEVAPADAVRELARELLRRVRGQRRLAHTAGAGERHHRRVAQQLCQASGLALASDEADPGQGHREGA